MNLSVSGNQLSFNAHVKLKTANPNVLKGVLKTTAGVASVGAGVASACTVFGPETQSVSPEVVGTAKDVLMSKPEGAELGVPVQSTVLPSGAFYSGIQLLKNGKKTLDLSPLKNSRKIPS